VQVIGQVVFAVGLLLGVVAIVHFRRDESEVGSKWLAVSLGVTGLGALLTSLLRD
jgi:protein-S-isoprenylcysteine O-methyltransferase Ste14